MPWLFYIYRFVSIVSKVINLLWRSHNLLDELTFVTLVKVYLLHLTWYHSLFVVFRYAFSYGQPHGSQWDRNISISVRQVSARWDNVKTLGALTCSIVLWWKHHAGSHVSTNYSWTSFAKLKLHNCSHLLTRRWRKRTYALMSSHFSCGLHLTCADPDLFTFEFRIAQPRTLLRRTTFKFRRNRS